MTTMYLKQWKVSLEASGVVLECIQQIIHCEEIQLFQFMLVRDPIQAKLERRRECVTYPKVN